MSSPRPTGMPTARRGRRPLLGLVVMAASAALVMGVRQVLLDRDQRAFDERYGPAQSLTRR